MRPEDDDVYVEEIITHEPSSKQDFSTTQDTVDSNVPMGYLRPKRTSRPIPAIPEAPPPLSQAPPMLENNSDFKTSLNSLSERVQSLEDDLGRTLTRDDLSTMNVELKGILPRIEENVKLTRKLQGEVATMQEDMQRLRQELQSSRGGGGGGGSPNTPRSRNKDLEELNISQVIKRVMIPG